MRESYQRTKSRSDKSRIIDQVCEVLQCHRKHAIRTLNQKGTALTKPIRRPRPLLYQNAIPAIQKGWEALDYPCAERLHPVLLETADLLAMHGELFLDDRIRQELAAISRSTLSRRLANMKSPKPKRQLSKVKLNGKLRAEVPVDRYDSTKVDPGALEIDLVEHNGGNSIGHFAYTLTVVDVVTQYSRRKAVLGRGQQGVFHALHHILSEWPYRPWGLHSDNGSEFLNHHLLRFSQQEGYQLTRSRPYKKNDNPHVEQKNLQFVREVVGYQRLDTPEDVEWLNQVYAVLDPYANFFLPVRKLVHRQREERRVRKIYDQARSPFQRLIDLIA
jgi:transposase InsO family protein